MSAQRAARADQRQARPVRLRDMIYFIAMEARRIRESQQLLIKTGWQTAPNPEAIYQAEVYEAAVRFLQRIEPVLGKVLAFLKTNG